MLSLSSEDDAVDCTIGVSHPVVVSDPHNRLMSLVASVLEDAVAAEDTDWEEEEEARLLIWSPSHHHLHQLKMSRSVDI